MNETQYISDFLAPRDAWDKLSIEEQAAMMKTAISEGILDLGTIRQKYNEFAEGGGTDPLEYTRQRFPVTKEFNITPYKDSSFTPEGMGNIEYMSAKHDTLPYYNNYQKPDSLKGRSVVVYNDKMGDAANEAIALDILSHGLREQDPTWRREYLPTLTDAFEGDAIYNMTDEDRKIYNLNDPEDRGEVIDNYIDGYIRAMAVDDKYRKDLNYAPRNVLNKEYNTLPPEQQNALVEAYSYIYPTRLPDVTVFGKKHSIGGPLVEDVMNEYKNGGGIHIKPSHRGRLTELKKRTGKTEAELYRTGSPATRKMITFARNARKWKHGLGGNLFLTGGPEERGREGVTNLSVWDELAAQSPLLYTIGKAVDPTGISGYGDAREAINQYDNVPSLNNGYTAVLETLGALPIVSKAGKAIKFLQGAVTGQGIFDDYNHAQEKMKEYGNELVVDYWDNTVKPRWEAEKHGEQMKSKMSYTDVHHVPSFKLAPKGSKSGQVISNYAINHRVVNKYKKALGGNLFDGTAEDSQQMQIGLKATNGWKPYTLDDILANATRIEQQKQAMKDRLNNVFILSNDASSVANGRLQNRHLERRTVEGAKQHAAWEKEHPVLNTIGTALGASPFAVAATPLLAAAGEAAAPVLTNPYVDAALTSGFGTHGLNHAINEGIDGWGDAAMTTLEVTPLGRLAVPITSKIMGNIADHSMNILRGDSPVEFVGSLYNYARRKPISFAEKQAAANRMETFIHSPEYIERQKAAGLSDSEIVDFQSMVSRRLNGGNFPAYTMKRKTSGLSLTLPKPFGGVYMREGIPYSDFLNAFDHEVAHYSTVNFGKSDNEFIKWLNRENPSVMEKVMNYNINSVPYRPESDVSKIRTARGLSPTTKNLNYYRNEQELRSNAYSMLQEAERRGISVDDLVDHYTMQSTGEIFGFAPAPLRYLNYAYTPENIKKYTKGFLSFATPLTFGIKYMNQDAK